MKKIAMRIVLAKTSLALFALTSCTTGSATRTSNTIYQPTNSSSVQILFEKPSRPYEVIGQVGSKGNMLASDDSIYRAMQKEAAELGAHAILVRGDGIDHEHASSGSSWGVWGGGGENYQRAKALALRWKENYTPTNYSVTPTSVTPTTPRETQIIPEGAGR